MNTSKELAHVFCSIQRALLGMVTPNLRAVYLVVEKESCFNLIFYYDKELSEEERELSSLVDTEFIADFPSPSYTTSCTIKIIPYPNPLPKMGFCVYQRYERR